jgi:dihydroorotase
MRLLLTGAKIWQRGCLRNGDILLVDGRIAQVQEQLAQSLHQQGERLIPLGASSEEKASAHLPVLDLKGHWILPGLVDTQVHFRDPGFPEKEDIESGSRSAVAGGMTAFLEMPNTKPTTTSAEALVDKLRRASAKSHCDFGFFMGATQENAEEISDLERLPGCCGVKVFMGSSTGTLLIADDAGLLRVLKSGRRRVALHAEDEDLLIAAKARFPQANHPRLHTSMRPVEAATKAVRRAIDAAQKTGRSIHILHVNSLQEMDLLRPFAGSLDISVEVTPQHLLLESPICYEQVGTLAQMNPPVREAKHREALWKALHEGVIDCLGSDHAPHTLKEKARPFPLAPSGMPGTETMFPLMFDQVQGGELGLADLVHLLAENPCRLYHLKDKGAIQEGYKADLTVVNPNEKWTVQASDQQSRCAWSAFEGRELQGRVAYTIVRGHLAYARGRFLSKGLGQALEYSDIL